MAILAAWLSEHLSLLVQAASAELSSDERLRATVEEAVAAFYDGLHHAAMMGSSMPVHAILIDWVESRSAPTDDELAGLLPVLTTLKRVTWRQITSIAKPEEAVQLLLESEELFTSSTNFLAQLEAEALLTDIRRELTKAQIHIQRLDKSKSDFIAVAAHELKTPLTLIEGYANMLRSEQLSEIYGQLPLMISGIIGGASRLREIIEDMIDVSMIDLRLLQLHYQPVWIHRLIEMAEYDLVEPLRERSIELVVERADLSDKPTYADPERLYQVFQKVVSNAVKYTPDGGKITIAARDLPGFTDVMISDTGIGIAPENLTMIFNKFSSMGDVALHSSGKVKFKGGGPGLGLAIAKGIIEAHGGTIWAESAGYNEKTMPGSMFHIMVPMRVAPPGDELAALYTPTEIDTGEE